MSEEKVIKRRKRERKITEIETALRIGDLVALRKLAAEEYGLVEGWFLPMFLAAKLLFRSFTADLLASVASNRQ